jgi:hypothetical protein
VRLARGRICTVRRLHVGRCWSAWCARRRGGQGMCRQLWAHGVHRDEGMR